MTKKYGMTRPTIKIRRGIAAAPRKCFAIAAMLLLQILAALLPLFSLGNPQSGEPLLSASKRVILLGVSGVGT